MNSWLTKLQNTGKVCFFKSPWLTSKSTCSTLMRLEKKVQVIDCKCHAKQSYILPPNKMHSKSIIFY